MTIRYMVNFNNQQNQALLLFWNNKNNNIFKLLKNMFNIQIIVINNYNKNDYTENNLTIIDNYKKCKNIFKNYDIHLLYDVVNADDKCQDIITLYNELDNIIKLFKPKSTLCRMPFITYAKDCDLTKNSSVLKGDIDENSYLSIIGRNFYKIKDIWIAPYDYYISYNMYFYIVDFKTSKNNFDEYFGRYNNFNIFKRVFSSCINTNINKNIGFDCCHDCALTNNIITEYCDKYNKTFEDTFNNITKLLNINFKTNSHGFNYKDLSNASLQSFIKPNLIIPITSVTVKYNK